MLHLRWATVVEVARAHPGLQDLTIELAGAPAPAIAYDDLSGPLEAGDRVLVNTTAVDLGLGTGGVHFVVAVEGRDLTIDGTGRAVKMRYAPVQLALEPAEDADPAAVDAVGSLDALPVVVAPLHSALPAVAIGIRSVVSNARIVYVMTDGAALPIAFSRTVPAMAAAGLLDGTITAGHAFGGDEEAVNLYSALAVAKATGADVVIAAMGPGNLGTGTRLGFAGIEVAGTINAAAALGGRAIVAPRISFADARARHLGVSHHTLTALALALAPAEIAVPPLEEARAAVVRESLRPLSLHRIVDVDLGDAEGALAKSLVPLSTMGRSFDDDPDYFRAAAAAGVFAARAL